MIEDVSSPTKADLLNRAALLFRRVESGEVYAATGLAIAFVARSGDSIQGWCWGYLLPRPDGTSMAYVHELEVVESERRQGIGRDLMLAFLGSAAGRGATKVFLTTGEANLPARALYDALGGRLAEQGPTVSYWFPLAPESRPE